MLGRAARAVCGEGAEGGGHAHLDGAGDYLRAGGPRRNEVCQRNEERNDEGRGGEQPEGVLHTRERVVHRGGAGTRRLDQTVVLRVCRRRGGERRESGEGCSGGRGRGVVFPKLYVRPRSPTTLVTRYLEQQGTRTCEFRPIKIGDVLAQLELQLQRHVAPTTFNTQLCIVQHSFLFPHPSFPIKASFNSPFWSSKIHSMNMIVSASSSHVLFRTVPATDTNHIAHIAISAAASHAHFLCSLTQTDTH